VAPEAVVPGACALALGLWGIDRQDSMWRDESVTCQVAHRSLGELWHLLGRIDAVHGLYYLLMHAVFGLWDGGLPALRVPSVLATAVAAAGVGAIAARQAGRRAGFLSGLVFATLPATQQYAQEGRSYALVTAGVTWAAYLFLRGTGTPRFRWWAGYAAVLALSCWLHEFAVLVLAAHALTLWWLHVPRRVWRRWAVASAVVLAAVLPLAVVSARQADRQLGWLGRPGPAVWLQFAAVAAVCALLARLLLRGAGGDPGSGGDADAGSDPGTGSHPGTGRATLVRLALPLALAPAGLLMTVSLAKPWYVDRYVLYGMTGAALLAGTALDRAITRRHRLAPAARTAVAGLSAVTALAVLLPRSLLVRSPESRKDDAVAVSRAVEHIARPGDAVLFLPARRREWLLSRPALYRSLDDLALAASPTASHTLQGTELPAGTIRRRILSADRIIALTDPPGQPLDPYPQEAAKRQALHRHFHLCTRTRLHGAQVLVYAPPGHCTPR
jgi:mannosyltransferase